MITTLLLLIIFNVILNKYVKNINNHSGDILKNLNTISTIYDYMKSILILYKANRVAINKISIENGEILKQMVHEVSLDTELLTAKIKPIVIEHDEYTKIKRLAELKPYRRYLGDISSPEEKKILLSKGITYVINIKLIDKISTAYILSIYFNTYNTKISKLQRLLIGLYLKIIKKIFKKNIDLL